MPVRYCGGKQRIACHIHKVIKQYEQEYYGEEMPYFEPFCGMMSVGLKFAQEKKSDRDIFVCDSNPHITAFWQEVKDGWEPPMHVSEKRYNRIIERSKRDPEELSRKKRALIAYAGSAYSFGGKMFSTYRGRYQSEEKSKAEGKATADKVLKAAKSLERVDVIDSKAYNRFKPKGFVIYCDPPYACQKDSTGNKHFQGFDSEGFWKTMIKWSKRNMVFISEIEGQAPDDFVCVWSKPVQRSLSSRYGSCPVKNECLFLHKKYVKSNT